MCHTHPPTDVSYSSFILYSFLIRNSLFISILYVHALHTYTWCSHAFIGHTHSHSIRIHFSHAFHTYLPFTLILTHNRVRTNSLFIRTHFSHTFFIRTHLSHLLILLHTQPLQALILHSLNSSYACICHTHYFMSSPFTLTLLLTHSVSNKCILQTHSHFKCNDFSHAFHTFLLVTLIFTHPSITPIHPLHTFTFLTHSHFRCISYILTFQTCSSPQKLSLYTHSSFSRFHISYALTFHTRFISIHLSHLLTSSHTHTHTHTHSAFTHIHPSPAFILHTHSLYTRISYVLIFYTYSSFVNL